MSRVDAQGEEIGIAYQERCIESWRLEGFEPISVNAIDEPYGHAVRKIAVSRDASALTGRSYVFLADVLAVASAEASGGPFVLMNADLIIRPNAALAAKVSKLSRGEFTFSRRIDIDQPTETVGMPWGHGYDFFAGHADDISALPDSGLVLGAPWWDHLLPLLMLTRGCRIYQSEPVVLHLRHEARWDWAVWEKLGDRFIAEARSIVRDGTYRSRLDNAVKGRSGLLPDLNVLGRTRNAHRRMLHCVSAATVSFLDEVAVTGA